MQPEPLSLLVCLVLLALAVTASAQQRDPAAAEALFQEARVLMTNKHYAEACPKFAESHRLDPGTGVLLFLGDCYVRLGHTASAWAAYQEALPRAKAEGKAERIEAAERGIAAMTPRLVKLSVVVAPDNRVDGLTITRDGVRMTAAAWGSAFPVDPGEHVVVASAPGHEPWTTKLTLREGDTAAIVEVPALSVLTVPLPAPQPTWIAPAPSPEPTPVASDEGMSTMRVAGFVIGGVGVAGLAAAAITGAVVLGKRGVLSDHCDDQKRCDDEGLDAASSAEPIAIANTVAWGVGIVGVGVGLVLVLAGGNDDVEAAAVQLLPSADPHGGGLVLRGSL
jgi:serine/threonine-protein kinase